MENSPMPAIQAISVIIYLIIAVFFIIVSWKIYQKAGKPGWAVLIPIYNIIVYLKIVSRPIWWIILYFIPIVNIIILIIMMLDLAKSFGKSGVWGFFMLVILGIIGYPILAFGKATYTQIKRS